MSLTRCRECNEEVSGKAEKCPNCGIKNPGKVAHIMTIIGHIITGLSLIIILFIIFIILPSQDKKTNPPSCEILIVKAESEVFIINDEPDAGYKVRTTVKNIGGKGEITINAILSTSEGKYSKSKNILYDSNETKDIYFSFYEPSVFSTNIRSEAKCTP